MFEVGQKVYIKRDIIEEDSDIQPRGCIAKTGDVVIIKKITNALIYPIHVAHEWVTDSRTFGVELSEIQLEPINENTTIVHS